ncbi:glycosyltransferase [Pseudofrankia asymbiotica]|uniref:Glycosyl transferase n=1 Tax=Pseudofrankia asymbiotica TaxID=1834516 RepID=A0A1V2I1Q7_9ACTN|nr:glycosyltransferase [Pseudofrankia asymbiotica]ONH23659.1 glycosyl transferase [Pseudofrankia asymbiotica]
MKISMVSEHASPLATLGGVDAGGQNVHVAALAEALARHDVDVTVHTRRDDPDLPRQVELGHGVRVDHVRAGPAHYVGKDALLPYMDDFADDLHQQWRRDRPDVVHAHFWMSGLAAVRAARPLGVPVVLTLHALGVVKRRHQGRKDTSPPDRIALEQRLVSDVGHIVATCTDEAFELVRMGAPRRRISVVPCGVDLSFFRPDGPADEPGPGRARLLFVGRLVERKGVGNVVSALAKVPDAELVVAGGPDPADLDVDAEVGRLRALAAQEGVADRVRFLGRVEHHRLPELYRSADVVTCVPWYEPFGIVPLEAMACGVPVVASAVGGLVDTVVEGGTGLHVPARSPERLAEALGDLLADPGWCRELGNRGARRVRELFSWDRVGGLTLNVYRRILAGQSVRTRRPSLPAGV